MRAPFRTILAASAAVALTAAAFAGPATAGPNKKGTTTIEPSATTLLAFNKVLKPGKFNERDTTVSFRIVGNPTKGPIKHVGGLKVNTLDQNLQPNGTLKLRNFRIDVGDLTVYGKVQGVGRAPLFSFASGDADDGVVELFFTETASIAITGDDKIEGVSAGVATIGLN